MTMTLPAAWLDKASESNGAIIVLVDFQLGAGTLGTYRLTNYFGIFENATSNNPIISDVINVGRAVDPVGRTVTGSNLTLEVVDDGTIRSWSASHNLKGKKVHIKLGFEGLSDSDFLTVYVGEIDDILPRQASLTISLKDSLGKIKSKYGGNFIGVHPVSALKELIQAGNRSLDLTSDFDSTDFDPTTYSSTISHFACTSVSMQDTEAVMVNTSPGMQNSDLSPGVNFRDDGYGATGVLPTKDQPFVAVRPLIDEICKVLQGTCFVDEAGKVRLKLFDASAASVRTLTVDDYDEIDQAEAHARTINRVRFTSSNSNQGISYMRQDANSVAALGEFDAQFNLAFMMPISFVARRGIAYTPSTTQDLTIDGGMVTGFTGTRGSIQYTGFSSTSFVPATDAGLTGSRTAKVAILSRPFNKSGSILCSSAVSIPTTLSGNNVSPRGWYHFFDNDGQTSASLISAIQQVDYSGTYTGDSVNVTQDTDDMDQFEVADVTPASRMADILLERFSRGCMVVKIRTSLRHIDLQLGDIIELETDRPLLDGADFDNAALSITCKWEIIEKEIELGDAPGVSFTLCQASLSTRPATGNVDVIDAQPVGIPVRPDFTSIGLGGSVLNGMDFSVSSGTIIDLAGGSIARKNGAIMPVSELNGITCLNNTDSYLRFDTRTGSLVQHEVSTTDMEPVGGRGEVTLARVRSSTGSISYIRDKRPLGMLKASQVSHGMRSGYNALLNGAFSDWSADAAAPPDNWSMSGGVWGTDAGRTDLGIDGDYAVTVPSGSSVATVELVSTYVPVRSSDVYLITGAFRASSGSPTGTIKVKFSNDAKITLSTVTLQTATLTTSWSKIGAAVTVPASAQFAQVLISRAGTGHEVKFDDIRMEQGSPAFSAKVNADTTLGTGSAVVLNFDNELMDLGGWYDASSYGAAIPVSGTYEVKISALFYFSGSGSKETALEVHLAKNGSNFLKLSEFDADSSNNIGSPQVVDCNVLIPAQYGDSFKVVIGTITAATSTVLAADSTFSMRLLR
tara:strand:- start:3894 stop:6956 length:3063 start_codon:yes stop_codon:yes gene_type:complete